MCIPHFVCPFINWTFGVFLVFDLYVILLWAFVHKSVCVYMCSSPLGRYLGAKLLGWLLHPWLFATKIAIASDRNSAHGLQIRSASTACEAPDFYGLPILVELPFRMSLVGGQGKKGSRWTGENVVYLKSEFQWFIECKQMLLRLLYVFDFKKYLNNCFDNFVQFSLCVRQGIF